MIAEIHVAPSPRGTPDDRFRHVEAAIEVIRASGLHHEVGALGTTFEGADDDVWRVLRAAHEAVLRSGADGVITSVRLGSATGSGAEPLSMVQLTAKYRR
jgi:uncharacterized protein YqgV (UPF0045/DUF77 family)